MNRISNLYKKSIIRLYENGTYSLEYAIIITGEQLDKKRLTEKDFEELMAYFEEEMMKLEDTEEIIEEDTDSNEDAEVTE